MKLAFEYADNLGQYVEAAKVLYQMNDQLPDDLQLIFEEYEAQVSGIAANLQKISWPKEP